MEVAEVVMRGDSGPSAGRMAIRKRVLAPGAVRRLVAARKTPSSLLLVTLAVIGLACLGVSGAGAVAAAGGADQDIQSLFSEACDLYEAGDFASAGDNLNAIKAAGLGNAVVYYNLGNCYYKQGQMGRAVANYRRALMLAPRDGDAQTNLDLIRVSVGGGDTTATYGTASATAFPMRLVSPKQLQALFYIAYYLAAAFFVGVLFLKDRLRRVAIYALVLSVVVAGSAFGFSSYGISKLESSVDAVVVVDRAALKSGPGPAFDEISALPDGAELRQRARSGIWVEVQLPTGEVGWVREKDIETI